MKKYLLLICLIFLLPHLTFAGPPTPKVVSNEVYDTSTWDGIKHKAPSKDAVRDKIETLEPTTVAETYGSGWNMDTSSASKNDVYGYLSQIDTNADASLDDQTITPTRMRSKLAKLTGAPTGADLVVGELYYADGAIWNPGGLSANPAHYVTYNSSTNWILDRDEDGNQYANKIQAAANVITDSNGINLTAAQMNSVIVMTGAGDVYIPAGQCDTATGQWIEVKSTAAHLNSIGSLEGSDAFVRSDGNDCGNGDELDLAGAAGNTVLVRCIQANKWWVMREIGTCVDGGAN